MRRSEDSSLGGENYIYIAKVKCIHVRENEIPHGITPNSASPADLAGND